MISNNTKVEIFGLNISHLSRPVQFMAFALGVFAFTVVYGCLQELIAVKLMNRRLALFLATLQFAGYAFWSYVLAKLRLNLTSNDNQEENKGSVPFEFYFRLSILRAIDVGMTNMSMQYLNYPAKTLIKSSRVVFTMLTGIVINQRRYNLLDYMTVLLIVIGLVVFLHADSKASIFHPVGVAMLTTSLICDGIINNLSECAMNNYKVGHDEFLFRLYSIAFVAMALVAHVKGELLDGIHFLSVPGTLLEIDAGHPPTCSTLLKIVVVALFATTGLFGSSCAAAITKYFSALSMSIVSTTRKAMTLFLSFALFHNACTPEHISGICIFLSALTAKSIRAGRKPSKQHHSSNELIKEELMSSLLSITRRKKQNFLKRFESG